MPTQHIHSLDTNRIAKIMSEALKEFSDHDYERSSFNRIIRNSGISKGTMYYYFENKQDLFMTLFRSATKDFQAFAGSDLSIGDCEAYWSRVGAMLLALMTIFSRKPSLGRFIQKFSSRASRVGEHPAQSQLRSIDDWLEDFLLTGQLVSAVRRDLPVDLLVQIAWGIWESSHQWLIESLNHSSPKDAAEILTGLLKRVMIVDASLSTETG